MAFDDVDMNHAGAPLYDSAIEEKRDLHSQLEDLFHPVWVAERLDSRKTKTTSAIDALDSGSNTDCAFDRNNSTVPVLQPGWRQWGLLRPIRRSVLILVRMVWVSLNVIAWLIVALVPIVVALLALLVMVCVYVAVAMLIKGLGRPRC